MDGSRVMQEQLPRMHIKNKGREECRKIIKGLRALKLKLKPKPLT